MLRLPTRKEIPPDGQMELVDHLAELRSRIFRSILYVVAAMVVTYNLVPFFLKVVFRPVDLVLREINGTPTFPNVTDGFFTWIQVSLISGLMLAFPFIVLELWGFIAPALTEEERKPIKYLAPFSVLLFFAGVGTGYVCLPVTFRFMGGYVNDFGISVMVLQDVRTFMLLTVKILLAFGLAFQLPLVLLFLARVGIISAEWMMKYWRHATVVIAFLSAVLTPSPDPLTMAMMGVPMAGLYVLSISLVRMFEKKPDGTRAPSLGAMLLVALAPVSILLAVGYWLARTSLYQAQTATITKTAPANNSSAASPAPPNSTGTVATPLPESVEALRIEYQKQEQRIKALEARLEALSKASPSATPSASATPAVPAPASSPKAR